MPFCIKKENSLMRTTTYQGKYETLLEADTRAQELAARSLPIACFQVCEGGAKNPGRAIGPEYKGSGR